MRHHDLPLSEKPNNSSSESLQEDTLTGPHKITYRPGKKWDFEGCTDSASIDIDLVMPPHRPRLQPENHRTGMFLSSEAGAVRAKVCRHALNRSFNLTITGGLNTDVVVWIPSNFTGFITVSGSHASFSPSFVERIMPNARINHSVPQAWRGDEINVETGGRVAFRVWDVLSRRAEPEKCIAQQRRTGDVWRRMFGGVSASNGASEKKGLRQQSVQTWDWDFLIED